MKIACTLVLFLVLTASAQGQWEIVRAESKPMLKQTSTVSEGFWLHVTIKNTTEDVLYVQGMKPQWFMIEAYIKNKKNSVWERQNTGVDRDLVMVPVKPGEQFVTVRREAVSDIGKRMLLTFRTAHSEHDKEGRRVLLGDFVIPKLSEVKKSDQDSPQRDIKN